ncbi:MAG: class I SAM-dependent methyltransferase [Candidatus Electrothrix sp. YB6]
MNKKNQRVCPVEWAGFLDNPFRKLLQNPGKILHPYLQQGMTVLDVGCGPGFFSIPAAEMLGASGQVIAADLQEGMLRKLHAKIQGTELEERIRLHTCRKDKIGVSEHADFALLFYIVHELPDQNAFFDEIRTILKPKGQVLMAEPFFHVARSAFEKTVRIAEKSGFADIGRPKIFFSNAVLLKKK